jgi:uncharacterized protein
MSKSVVGNVHLKQKDLSCPRDGTQMKEKVVGEAQLDVCAKCGGQYFDAGEMFAAFGIKADPSIWDRPELGGKVKEGAMNCARCGAHMLGQDITYEGKSVEIDRCGHCGGIWLDKGEVEQIMALGDEIKPLLDAEKAKAQAELDKLSTDILTPNLIARFLGIFRKG